MHTEPAMPTEPEAAVWTLLYAPPDEAEVQARVLPSFAAPSTALAWQPGQALPALPSGSRVATWLDDAALRELLPQAGPRGWVIGLLPHPQMPNARFGFGIASRLEQAQEDLARLQMQVDLLYCNDTPVLHSVLAGDSYSLTPARDPGEGLWRRLRRFVRLMPALSALRLRPFRLQTHKDKVIETAALGIVVVGHGRSTPLARRLLEDSSVSDGMLHALLLAPRSVVEFLRFLLASVLLPGRSSAALPPFVGHIKTQGLRISNGVPFDYRIDGVPGSGCELLLRVEQKAFSLVPGRHLSAGQASDKESFRSEALPQGEARKALIAEPMPLIHHAASEEFRELFLILRENARASEAFLTLMVLATLLASVGLFADSAPVIIGAMILAPLMAPIISLAMGVLRQDERLLGESLRTLCVGMGLALLCSVLLSWLMPLQTVNGEIAARLQPTLLDLAVAVISGVAGAYAHARAEVAKSLAGVAIAVALVPPLAVTGMGIGWLDWHVFSGALLLFLTNLAGIVMAAALTFLVLGYSPFSRARRGLLLSLLLVLLVSVPLALGFQRMVEEHRIQRTLTGWQLGDVLLQEVSVRPGEPMHLQVRLLSPRALQDAQLDALKQAIEQRLQRPVLLEVVVAILR